MIYCQEQLGPKAAVSLTVLRDLEAARYEKCGLFIGTYVTVIYPFAAFIR